MSAVLYLAELLVYDGSISDIRTLRYATGQGFTTKPTDAPSNTFYDPRIKQPAVLTRDLFGSGTTLGMSRVGYGDLILLNGDGDLDALTTYGFDGRVITEWRGEPGAAYPGGFSKVFVGTMESVEVNTDFVVVKIRDRQLEVQVPLQTTKYLGDNALPAGLEGVTDDLKGKPKPVCLGVVKNVPAILVNTSKLIYQVNDRAVDSVDAVYDKGVRLTGGVQSMTDRGLVFAGVDVDVLVYSPELNIIVAAGASGQCASSSDDGVTWTARTSQFGISDIAAGCWEPSIGLFLLGGEDGKISTSPDGTTWTARTSGFGTAWIRACTGGAGLFVIGSNVSSLLSTSPDGITFTSRTSPLTGVSGLGFGNSIGGPVYVGGGPLGGASNVMTSPDGITWTARVSSFGASGDVRRVAFGNGTFFICGDDGTNPAVATSNDGGVSWVNRGDAEPPSGTSVWEEGVFLGNGFIVGGSGDSALSVSDPLGINWRRVDNPAIVHVDSIVLGEYAHVIGQNTGRIWSSTGLGTYASEADLLDETLAPQPGVAKYYAAGGYFRLGSPPAGLITADVTQGAAASDRTAGQLFTDVLTLAQFNSVDWSASDITALDTANASVLGYWTDEETTTEQALNLIAESVGAWWGVDRLGIFRIKQFTAPEGTAIVNFTANDLLRPLARIQTNDRGRGLPVFQTIVRWGRVYAVQTTDLALGVSSVRRAFVGKEWREAKKTDATVQTRFLLAPQTIEDSLLTVEADAQTEATRRQALRGTLRDVFGIVVPLNDDTEDLDLGDVVELKHSRYGLSAGKDFRILRVEPNAMREELSLTLWGPADLSGVRLELTLAGTGT